MEVESLMGSGAWFGRRDRERLSTTYPYQVVSELACEKQLELSGVVKDSVKAGNSV